MRRATAYVEKLRMYDTNGSRWGMSLCSVDQSSLKQGVFMRWTRVMPNGEVISKSGFELSQEGRLTHGPEELPLPC